MASAAAVAVADRMTPAAISAPAVRPARRRAARWRPVRATATWTTTFRSKAARRAVPSARRGAAAYADRHRAGERPPDEKPDAHPVRSGQRDLLTWSDLSGIHDVAAETAMRGTRCDGNTRHEFCAA